MKYSKAYNKFSIKRALEEELEDAAILIAQHDKKPEGKYGVTSRQMFVERKNGILDVAAKLGFGCGCKESKKLGRDVCKCTDKGRYGIRVGRMMTYGLAGFALVQTDEGLRCRDGTGAFVPVGQCKGPVGRDPRTGRFVSIK